MVSTARQLALVLLLPCALATCAQESSGLKPEQDFELWWSASFGTQPFMGKKLADRKFAKKFTTSLEFGQRSDQNAGNNRLLYATVSARYRYKKWLRFGLDHRVGNTGSEDNTSHRMDAQAVYVREFGRFRTHYRLNFQHGFEAIELDENIVRNRVGIEWNTRKFPIDPYIQAEAFSTLHYEGNYLSRMRYDLGAKWGAGAHDISGVFRHQRQIGIYAPEYIYVVALNYGYFWDRKKK